MTLTSKYATYLSSCKLQIDCQNLCLQNPFRNQVLVNVLSPNYMIYFCFQSCLHRRSAFSSAKTAR